MRWRDLLSPSDRDVLVKEASHRLDAPTRRLFLKRAAGVGTIAAITGVAIVDGPSAEQALASMSTFNDRVQAWLFDPTRVAKTFVESEITRPFPFNAFYDAKDAPESDDTWRAHAAQDSDETRLQERQARLWNHRVERLRRRLLGAPGIQLVRGTLNGARGSGEELIHLGLARGEGTHESNQRPIRDGAPGVEFRARLLKSFERRARRQACEDLICLDRVFNRKARQCAEPFRQTLRHGIRVARKF